VSQPIGIGAGFGAIALWVIVGFVISAIVGAILLAVLPRLQFQQTTYELAPETHRQKSGTPTMGGICFAVALLPLAWGLDRWPFVWPIFTIVFGCALIGFVDDLLGVRRGKNMGLSATTKYLATALIAIIFLRQIYDTTDFFPRDVLFHAGTFVLTAPHWLWFLLGILAVTGTVHAVNLTDGLDGLATGTMVPALSFFACLSLFGMEQQTPAYAALLGIGACLGFLIYNRYKAKMIMGDVGSLALGALLSACAILTGEMLLLLLVGGVFVAEALSVILQVTYFKATKGKRIFRMSPLHHHFELAGWPETTVTLRFWIASLLCALVAWVIVR
jgi:phospho-N-acetylmuramoyl-pentapeptide-transferase